MSSDRTNFDMHTSVHPFLHFSIIDMSGKIRDKNLARITGKEEQELISIFKWEKCEIKKKLNTGNVSSIWHRIKNHEIKRNCSHTEARSLAVSLPYLTGAQLGSVNK